MIKGNYRKPATLGDALREQYPDDVLSEHVLTKNIWRRARRRHAIVSHVGAEKLRFIKLADQTLIYSAAKPPTPGARRAIKRIRR